MNGPISLNGNGPAGHRRRRLIFATQVVDPDDPVLGATVPKLRALAAELDELVVLADRAVEGALPSNCSVHTFGAASVGGRTARFIAALRRELAPAPLAVVAHMVPRYAILAASATRSRRVPVLLWFTHWKQSRTLRLAERLSTAVLSVDRRSFPFPSAKVVGIGHGIDTDAFAYVERPPGGPLKAVSLGRISPAKGYETIARGAALAGVELEIRGASLTGEERAERARLEALGVRVEDPVPFAAVPALLAGKDVLVNNMREGALDKVVYEAAATGMPVLASNAGFDDVLPPELRFDRTDPADLAERLRLLESRDRNALGRELRARVEERHSVRHWARALLQVADRAASG